MTYNQPVQPRGQGEETNVKIPDFIVVKGSATLSGDVPLLIVEVKRDESDDVIARNQITNYMGAFITKFGNMKLKAALVQGSRVLLYEWPSTAPFMAVLKKTTVITDDTFLKWVRKVAKDHWDV